MVCTLTFLGDLKRGRVFVGKSAEIKLALVSGVDELWIHVRYLRDLRLWRMIPLGGANLADLIYPVWRAKSVGRILNARAIRQCRYHPEGFLAALPIPALLTR